MTTSAVARAFMPAIAPSKRCAALAMVCALLMAACSKRPDPAAAAAREASPPPAAPAANANATSGSVTGRVPPPSGGAAVVVVLEPRTTRTFPEQREKPVMDQVGQTFEPEVLIVRTGQPVEFRNNDDTLHNVHVSHDETHEPAFNVAIPTGGTYTYSFPRDGFYRVGCDIHPAMAATIFSSTTPFATLAGSDGRFAFDDVPAGPWTVSVYAAGHRMQRDVDVGGGAVDITVE